MPPGAGPSYGRPMTEPRLLSYCEEQPERRAGKLIAACGVVHAARPGSYQTLCGTGLETLHLVGPRADGGAQCPLCWGSPRL